MSDSETLGADIYLPPGEGPWPAILIQTPYNKNQYVGRFTLEYNEDPLTESPDYAFVVLDWRGFFESADAAYSGNPTRGEDGYDAVEWIADQPWCTGAVGTWGASALGRAQLDTVLQKPPSLRACVPMVCNAGDEYELWFPGGVYYENRNGFISVYFGAGDLYKEHPTYDLFWSFLESLLPTYQEIETPMLFVSGWYDHETAATIGQFLKVRAAQSEEGESPTRMLIGPWSHGELGETVQGALSYPDAEYADSAAALAFFDEHLRGISPEPGTSPVMSLYQINEGEWISAETWPPLTEEMTLYLGASGTLDTSPNDALSTATLVSDPNDPVPTIWGAILQGSEWGQQGPGDIGDLVSRSDTLFFQTPQVSEPLRMAGQPHVRVFASTSARDIDIAARLVQIAPDGKVVILADGIRRASLRNGFEEPELLDPETVYEIPVQIAPIAATIPVGHRLGVLIAPSNHDLFSVNPQNGESFAGDGERDPTVAPVDIWLGGGLASELSVPVWPSGFAQVSTWTIY